MREIDTFARHWFEHWDIGSEEQNSGILLLVSHGDSRTWIELGTAWGPQWNSYRERVMKGLIIPLFKKTTMLAVSWPGFKPSSTWQSRVRTVFHRLWGSWRNS